jgi:hypothetical protein
VVQGSEFDWEVKTDIKFLQLSQNLTIDSLLIYVFCTNCGLVFVFICRTGRTGRTKSGSQLVQNMKQLSNFGLIEEIMDLSRILLAVPSKISDTTQFRKNPAFNIFLSLISLPFGTY